MFIEIKKGRGST